ncbi:flagellar hook-length control protein FliK [Serpentinicella alkaliphila]|uniref:Flagellar hook-length control protein FliK n=1 Tax=Serpentinicella alkaliphila TaxID=1734049 RepID=A0A4R2TPW1_9FIRM|nr:flagellar hook-length control protein FliK [Serpentinicella alkaliphila]QUH26280.1 flagellar hook-length control protein FliK [Serpentinicella alkaliphila]TCQ05860.1 flagellar hook-length control protein FliK [Serpentinicella alkaliphila]
MNGINQLLVMDFSSNKFKNTEIDFGSKKDSSFQNILHNTFKKNTDKNFNLNNKDNRLPNDLKLMNSPSVNFNKFTAKEGSKLTNESSLPLETETDEVCIIETSSDEEVCVEMLLDLINMLQAFVNDEPKDITEKIKVVFENLNELNVSENFKQEVSILLTEISSLIENFEKTAHNSDFKSAYSEKLNELLNKVSKLETKETNKKNVKELKVTEEKDVNVITTPNNKDSVKPSSNQDHSYDTKEKKGNELNTKEFSSSLVNDEELKNEGPKEANISVTQSIRGELLSKVSANGLPSKVNSNNIMTQIASQINKVNLNGLNEIKIQLMPENLGKLSLKISTTDNLVSAKIIAESIQIKEIIESNLNQLRDSLSEKGISISNVEVFVGQDSDAYRHKQALQQMLKGKKSNNSIEDIQLVSEDVSIGVSNPYLEENSFDMMG